MYQDLAQKLKNAKLGKDPIAEYTSPTWARTLNIISIITVIKAKYGGPFGWRR
jgi:hypothetical protein